MPLAAPVTITVLLVELNVVLLSRSLLPSRFYTIAAPGVVHPLLEVHRCSSQR
jgi:hypothetical protein